MIRYRVDFRLLPWVHYLLAIHHFPSITKTKSAICRQKHDIQANTNYLSNSFYTILLEARQESLQIGSFELILLGAQLPS